jgi:ABC-type bacteriocin/lantibiotic exporter with double-glycine peptidase domain
VNTVGIVVIFSLEDWTLATALIFYIVGYFVIGTVLLKKAVAQERIVNKSFEDLSSFSFESVNNIQTIKALGIDAGILRVIRAKVTKLVVEIRSRIAHFQRRGIVLYVFEVTCLLSIVTWIVFGVMDGRYDVSVFVLFIGLYRRVNTSVEELTEATQQLALAKIWVSRAMTILHIEPTIEGEDKTTSQQLYPEDWQKLVISHVGFAYKKGHILKDISLTIRRGEKIGIVGLSGAGKSTLFKLLLDLYENYEGTISLDDVPLTRINRQSYIDHVSVVLQDTELFDMSLRENIEIARPSSHQIDSTLLHAAIQILSHLCCDLPSGIETLIGEKGFKLWWSAPTPGIARALPSTRHPLT